MVREGDENDLPALVRYVKNGAGGKWWSNAKDKNQIHAGWDGYPDEMILSRDLAGLRAHHGNNQTQDYNALLTLLRAPEYLWVTIQAGFLWWCTASNEIGVDPDGSNETHGHFWLTCDRPWSNKSLNGNLLAVGDLPGAVTQIASYRATVCEPSAATAIRRIILGEKNPAVLATELAKEAFAEAVGVLVKDLHHKDFEILVDLILQRTGWARIANLGGVTEGIDVEAENAATGEIAFVQVKSRTSQSTLNEYIAKFQERRERYARMIFAAHTVEGSSLSTSAGDVHVWDGKRVADLVVTLGLSDWLGRRV